MLGGYISYNRESFIGQVEIKLNKQRQNITLQEYWDLRITVPGLYMAPILAETVGGQGSTKYFNEDDINFIHKYYIEDKVRPDPIIAQYDDGRQVSYLLGPL